MFERTRITTTMEEYQQTEVIRRNSIDEFVKFEPQEGEEKPIVNMILNKKSSPFIRCGFDVACVLNFYI